MNFPFNNGGWFIPAAIAAVSAFAKKKTQDSNIISNFGNSVASGVGSAVGGALGGKLSDKITGIPSALSASEQGQQAMDYMNAAYPGTTVWDRLGAGGAGAPSSTSAVNTEKMKMRQENKMQSRALTTQAMIADRQNRTHLISTAAGYGIDGIKQVLNAYDGFRQTPYETPVSQSEKRLPSEIAKNEAETKSKQYGVATPINTLFNLDEAKKQAPHIFRNLKKAFDFSTPKFDDNGKKLPNRFKFKPIR